MKRRDVIKYSALSVGALLGNTFSNSLIAKTLDVFKNDEIAFKLKHFKNQQFELLTAVIDSVLPETNSPSASQVGVHFLMDSIIAEVMNDEEKLGLMVNFEAMDKYLTSKEFLNLNSDQKTELLSNILLEENDIDDQILWGVQTMRAFSIDLYLVTEKIAEEHLNYIPVPGNYEPCINVSEAKNTRWAI